MAPGELAPRANVTYGQGYVLARPAAPWPEVDRSAALVLVLERSGREPAEQSATVRV